AGRLARIRRQRAEANQRLIAAFNAVPEDRRDRRWQERIDDIRQTVNETYEAEATKYGLTTDQLDDICKIAHLPITERERRRKEVARGLGIRVGVIDELLKTARGDEDAIEGEADRKSQAEILMEIADTIISPSSATLRMESSSHVVPLTPV